MQNERGMTLVEVLVSLAIVAVLIAFSTRMVTTAYRGTQDNIHKQFATQKAMSMLEELRALIQTQNGATTIVLDNFDDGTTSQPLLTTQSAVTNPAAPASGNTPMGAGWLYSRRITVQRVPSASDLRLVNVKVFIHEASGTRLLAEVASVLSTIGQNAPPTQVYDVYLVAIENVPGWWLYMQNVVTFVEGAMNDLESRHPGLQFRRHWIRKLSYGRDPLYAPYVNRTGDSTQSIDSVYFYPGTLPSGSPVQSYYPPDFFQARVRIDGDLVHDFDPTNNPAPYALADQFNNGMRHADERRLFEQRVAARLESADAPTLRLLLDDMYLRPAQYRNAIVINLHGELFPFPPVRNYSDAAKDPRQWPNVRVVTHPERLRYTNANDVRLRVYSYHNAGNAAAVPDWLGRGTSATPISVVIKGLAWLPPIGAVEAIGGGVDADGNGAADPYARTAASTSPSATQMWWSREVVGGDTILRLYNSPLKTPCAQLTNPCDAGGLAADRTLYGLQYIPAPVENLPDYASPAPFATNLVTPGVEAKNTARWIITIPSSALRDDQLLEIETRIGSDLTTGAAFPIANGPSNLSRTYVWRGSDAWIEQNLPITERFQFLGDPRHSPYADNKLPHTSDPLGMGYNRYFDDFHDGSLNAAARWPGYSYVAPALSSNWYGIKNNSGDTNNANDGWNTRDGLIEIDVPRVYQVLRSAVTRSNAVYTTMTGFSYFYVGIGGEIGYDDSNGFANSIPVSSKPFTGAAGTRNEQSITNALSGGVKYIRENENVVNYWWSMSWLGELYPDSQIATWTATGNLPTGSGSGRFVRTLRGSITPNLPAGTTFLNTVRRTQEEGSTTFFWSGRADATFHHRYADNTTGNRVAQGNDIETTYKVPLAPSISNERPFSIAVNDTGMNPDHFLQPVYGAATTLSPLAEFYRHSTNIHGSALLAMRDGGDAAFVVVNGLSPVGESGTAFISRWSFLSLVHGFLSAGLFRNAGVLDPARVRQLPQVVITTPDDSTDIDNPSTLRIGWQSQWRRWDGLAYTPDYPGNYADDTTVRFAVLYSRDNGRTWLHVEDDATATPGRRPDAAHLRTTTHYDWSVPAARFPRGNYLIRVEAYRDEVPLHYAFHQFRAFFRRS